MGTSLFEFINPRYLLGISDEPQQMLQPITGYAYEPLLSLEDACVPLLNIVPRLEAHIWIAKQNSKIPPDDLTQDESAAIRLYTMEWDAATDQPRGSLYVHLNRTLKQVDRTKLRPWFRYLKLFLTALAKLPPEPRQTVWRGVRKDHSADYPPGAKATWWAFSSCTTSLSVLESDLYLGQIGTRTLFSIETINGRTIRAHSHFTAEDEILLLPGTYFEVKSRLNPAPDLYIVHLQQKVPPHVLLEPPFEGAELLPLSDTDRVPRKSFAITEKNNTISRPWYKRKRILMGIGAVIAVIIIAVILGSVLGTRKKNQPETNSTSISSPTSTPSLTTPLIPIYFNGSVPNPVSVADAFYAFDGNTDDLYSRRPGEVIGGSVSYSQGYVPYGTAITLNQSNATQINIQPTFILSGNSSFTLEGFFMLNKTQLNATLIELAPTIGMILIMGKLSASLGTNVSITGTSTISTERWHHFSFVYDGIQQIATISIDGNVEKTRSSVQLDTSKINVNSTIIVGAGFQGFIDQLSIILKAKTQADILWDATTAGYYPMDTSWLLDKGPNGLNASASNVIPIYGWRYNALNFNSTDAYYQASGFTALGLPQQAFSIAVWIRSETQAGVFLTIGNSFTCLLVLGLQTEKNRLIAYLPNAAATGDDVTIIGPEMPSNAWTHVAFTWSSQNLAKVYTSGYLQAVGANANTLNNVRGGNNTQPMTITLGKYNGPANCRAVPGINTTQTFMGSLDELFVFAREIQPDELISIIQSLPD